LPRENDSIGRTHTGLSILALAAQLRSPIHTASAGGGYTASQHLSLSLTFPSTPPTGAQVQQELMAFKRYWASQRARTLSTAVATLDQIKLQLPVNGGNPPPNVAPNAAAAVR
jgi:hypothetical protein